MDFSETDGLYGSKHLAKKWSNPSSYLNKKSVGFVTELQRIRLFVLLDLIGQTSPKFFTYSVSEIQISGIQIKGGPPEYAWDVYLRRHFYLVLKHLDLKIAANLKKWQEFFQKQKCPNSFLVLIFENLHRPCGL